MSSVNPLPKTHIHTTHRLTHASAHEFLTTFLSLSETNPSYRPDSILTQYGPQSANTGAQSNITLNNLSRICRGINGESLSGIEWNDGKQDLEESPTTKRRKTGNGYTKSEPEDAMFNSSPPEVSGIRAGENGDVDQAAIVAEEIDGWQDKEDFEHAQTELIGDLGGDPATAGIERRGDKVNIDEVPHVMTDKDREARKAAKKLRNKDQKKTVKQKKVKGEDVKIRIER